MELNEAKIGKNPPASGIKIFEEHNQNPTQMSNLNKTRKSSNLSDMQ